MKYMYTLVYNKTIEANFTKARFIILFFNPSGCAWLIFGESRYAIKNAKIFFRKTVMNNSSKNWSLISVTFGVRANFPKNRVCRRICDSQPGERLTYASV